MKEGTEVTVGFLSWSVQGLLLFKNLISDMEKWMNNVGTKFADSEKLGKTQTKVAKSEAEWEKLLDISWYWARWW